MHIFVINLLEDTVRRASIEKQLRELGMSYEIFPGLSGKSLSPAEKAQHYYGKWFMRNVGRPAMPGELGCALSHIAIYRIIIERNLPYALILEDDAWLNPNIPYLLQAIEQKHSSEKNDIFLLTWVHAVADVGSEALWSSYRLSEMRIAHYTHGYVVSNAAAGALIQALYPIRDVADCWRRLRRHKIVKILAVYPPCITIDYSYETRTRPELVGYGESSTPIERLTRKLYRGYWRLYDHVLAWLHRVGKSL